MATTPGARLDFLPSEGGLFRDVALIEAEAAKFHDRLQARYGKRLRLPATPEQLVASWPRLSGSASRSGASTDRSW